MTDVVPRITRILNRQESVQLVSLPGMGASRLVKSLPGLYLDYNLVSHLTTLQLIEKVSGDPVPELIVLDPLNNFIIHPDSLSFFNFLKGVRDQNKSRLKFLFIYKHLHPVSPGMAPVFGSLFPLVAENIVYLTPYPLLEIGKIIQNRFSSSLCFNPNSNQLRQITKLSGGIPALIKIVMQAMRDDKSLEIDQNPRLRAQLDEIQLAIGNNPDPEILTKHGLLNDHGDFHSQLLKEYLDRYSSPAFSAAETRLLELLTASPNKPVSKDRICEVVYPDVKNRAGISDHAIDQLVHRLRDKVKFRYRLQTHRGLGYTLLPL